MVKNKLKIGGKIKFNIAYFSPIVISCCRVQKRRRNARRPRKTWEKNKRNEEGTCYLATEGRNFHRYSSPRPFAICHHSFISVFTASSCLMPCRFANNADVPPSPFFYEFAVKIYDSPVVDRSLQSIYTKRRLQ